jgi:nucleotide-binding universal stress UspA family protein
MSDDRSSRAQAGLATTATSAGTVILAALDESERAPAVFAAALRLARALPAQVYLMRVLVFPPEIAAAGHTTPDHLELKLQQDARNELRARMQGAPDIEFGPEIIVGGDPWRRILDIAEQFDVDLIVVGCHRRHGMEHLLGTTSSKVVNHARRDVLVVHDSRLGQKAQPSSV